MKNLLLSAVCILALSSCIGVESRISLNNDGTGTLQLDYRISRFMKDLDVGKEEKQLPLPVSREDFERAVAAAPGLKLAALSQREDEQDVRIEARIEFDRPESVNALGREDQMGLSFSSGSGQRTFRQQVYRGRNFEGLSPESLQLLETFFAGYELSYRITAPAPILQHSGGELSADRRSLSFKTTIPELMGSREERVLEVVW